jgi:hypothetical protein
MTSPRQPGQPSDTHEPSEETLKLSQNAQQPARRLSLSRNKSGWLWITLSLIALAGLSTALITVVIGGGTRQPTSGQATPGGSSVVPGTATGVTSGSSKVGQVPTGTSTAKGKVTSAAQLAESGGALSLSAGMQSRAANWQSGPGGTDLTAVSTRLGDALQAAGIRQYSAMKYACARLASSVPTAQAGPQIPDAAMQKLYAKALAELAKGAASCRSAVSSKTSGDETVETHIDPTLLRLSISELAAGARDVFRSTAEIEIASRRHH